MFNLEIELGKWRREMRAAGLKTPEIISELEEHLREDIEQQVRSGIGVAEAFQAALQRIGQPSVLRSEFDMINKTGIGDTLRRHKWKLLLCSGTGLLAAIALHVLRPAPYQSEAKMLIRYVAADVQSLALGSGQRAIATVSDGALEKIMNEEVEILTSWDLAQHVAKRIGPKKILAKAGGGEDLIRATTLIKEGLRVAVLPKSSVIRLAFRHRESGVIQPVLREVIDEFLKIHVESHRMHVESNRAAGFPNVAIGSVTNISQIQSPSPPFFDFAASCRMLVMVVSAGVLAGLAWVFAVRLSSDYSERHHHGIG